MTDNEKIQQWATGNKYPVGYGCPNYSTDAEAIQLLNVLVEKGYEVTLIYTHNGATVDISKPIGRVLVECDAPTIHKAITSAVLQVIEMEAQDE